MYTYKEKQASKISVKDYYIRVIRVAKSMSRAQHTGLPGKTGSPPSQ